MWNRVLSGKSNIDEQSSTRHCSGSTVSKDSKKKSSSQRNDDRDPRFNPTSTSYSSTSRAPYQGVAAPSVASSYATASGNNDNNNKKNNDDEPYQAPGLIRNSSLADKMPKSKADRNDDRATKKDRRRDRSRSRDRGERREKKEKRDNKPKRLKDRSDGLETSRGPAEFENQIGNAGFAQFPGQYDDGMIPGPIDRPQDHSAEMSSHVQDQFPGQFPAETAGPYRPPLSSNEGGPGLAAEYYGDAGESVAEQPGFRLQSPSLIIGAEPHLLAASAVAKPPPEPSALGSIGAAASFYSGELDQEDALSSHAPPPSSYVSATSRPNGGYHSSASILPAVGGAAAGAAAGYVLSGQSSSHHQHLDGGSSVTGVQTEIFAPTTQLPPAGSQDSYFAAYSRPSNLNGRPSHSSSIPLMTGAAGIAAAAYDNRHDSHQHDSIYNQHTSTSMKHRRRRTGPLGALVDFFRDPDAVAQFEEYSELTGVCSGCFEPGSTPRDAPRKHRYYRRRSNERYGSSSRVDKDNRYYSSENENRRKKDKSWIATGLAGYGLGKVGETLFNQKHDFDDTYTVKSGRFSPDRNRTTRRSYETRKRRTGSNEHIVTGVTNGARVNYGERHNGPVGGSIITTHSTRRRSKSRSRSRSKDRKSGIAGVALDAAIGSSVAASAMRRRSRSPTVAFVRTNHKSEDHSSDGRHKADRKKKKTKKDRGFFGFAYASSSSSSVDLTYRSKKDRQRSSKAPKSQSKDDREAKAALVGLGAAAAALALKDGRQGHKAKGVKDLVPVKETKVRPRKHADHGRSSKPSTSSSEEGWVSASQDEISSVDSDLAFGLPESRGSRESFSSESSGTDKWGWRWGSKRNRRQTPPSRTPSRDHSLPAIAGGVGAAVASAAMISSDQYHRPEVDSTSSLPLQLVYPIPTSDPGRFDVQREEDPMAQVNLPMMTSRPEAVPIQHPRPIAPVSSVLYSTQPLEPHSYSAPSGPPVFAQSSKYTSPTNTHDIRSVPQASSRPGGVGQGPTEDFKLQRRDTSPARFGKDATSIAVTPPRRSSAKDDSSAVRFNLTEEQEEKDRRERRRSRKDEERTDEKRRASKDRVNKEDASGSTRSDHSERSSEISWAVPAAIGIAGAAVGAAALADKSKDDETEERRERRRRERERERKREIENEERAERQRERERRRKRRQSGREKEESIEQNERREKEPELDEKSTIIDSRVILGDPPEHKDHYTVWQEAAAPKHVAHEDYQSFFAPTEILNESRDQAKITSASPNADLDLHETPRIIEITPRARDSFKSPIFSPADTDEQIDPSTLPFPVPRLRLVEPTPVPSRSVTPIINSEDPTEKDDHKSSKDRSPPKVSWADQETNEEAAHAPADYQESPIEASAEEVSHEIEAPHHSNSIQDEVQQPEPASRNQSSLENGTDFDKPSTTYHDDTEFAATIAAAAEDAGFDPSIVIDNPTYRRRESPPFPSERSMPGSFEEEDGLGNNSKGTETEGNYPETQTGMKGSQERDDEAIVQDMVNQVEQLEPQEANGDAMADPIDEWEGVSKRNTKSKKSRKGRKGAESKDEAPTREDQDDLESSPKDSTRDTTSVVGDTGSTVSSASFESGKDAKSKSKKGSGWDRLPGKTTNRFYDNDNDTGVKDIKETTPEEPKRKSKKSKDRNKSYEQDDEDKRSTTSKSSRSSKKERTSQRNGDNSVDTGTNAQRQPAKEEQPDRSDRFPPAGLVTRYLEGETEPEHIEKQESESFLGMRPEPPPPPDTSPEAEEPPGPSRADTTAVDPWEPPSNTESLQRRPSDINESDISTRVMPSPTDTSFPSRRPMQASRSRSMSQTPYSSTKDVFDLPRRQMRRPRSTEFKPLRRSSSPEEVYPPLPFSRTTSAGPSVHDPDEHDRAVGEVEMIEKEHKPLVERQGPAAVTDGEASQSDVFESHQATPTAALEDGAAIEKVPLHYSRFIPSAAKRGLDQSESSANLANAAAIGGLVGFSAAFASSKKGHDDELLGHEIPEDEAAQFKQGLEDMAPNADLVRRVEEPLANEEGRGTSLPPAEIKEEDKEKGRDLENEKAVSPTSLKVVAAVSAEAKAEPTRPITDMLFVARDSEGVGNLKSDDLVSAQTSGVEKAQEEITSVGGSDPIKLVPLQYSTIEEVRENDEVESPKRVPAPSPGAQEVQSEAPKERNLELNDLIQAQPLEEAQREVQEVAHEEAHEEVQRGDRSEPVNVIPAVSDDFEATQTQEIDEKGLANTEAEDPSKTEDAQIVEAKPANHMPTETSRSEIAPVSESDPINLLPSQSSTAEEAEHEDSMSSSALTSQEPPKNNVPFESSDESEKTAEPNKSFHSDNEAGSVLSGSKSLTKDMSPDEVVNAMSEAALEPEKTSTHPAVSAVEPNASETFAESFAVAQHIEYQGENSDDPQKIDRDGEAIVSQPPATSNLESADPSSEEKPPPSIKSSFMEDEKNFDSVDKERPTDTHELELSPKSLPASNGEVTATAFDVAPETERELSPRSIPLPGEDAGIPDLEVAPQAIEHGSSPRSAPQSIGDLHVQDRETPYQALEREFSPSPPRSKEELAVPDHESSEAVDHESSSKSVPLSKENSAIPEFETPLEAVEHKSSPGSVPQSSEDLAIPDFETLHEAVEHKSSPRSVPQSSEDLAIPDFETPHEAVEHESSPRSTSLPSEDLAVPDLEITEIPEAVDHKSSPRSAPYSSEDLGVPESEVPEAFDHEFSPRSVPLSKENLAVSDLETPLEPVKHESSTKSVLQASEDLATSDLKDTPETIKREPSPEPRLLPSNDLTVSNLEISPEVKEHEASPGKATQPDDDLAAPYLEFPSETAKQGPTLSILPSPSNDRMIPDLGASPEEAQILLTTEEAKNDTREQLTNDPEHLHTDVVDTGPPSNLQEPALSPRSVPLPNDDSIIPDLEALPEEAPILSTEDKLKQNAVEPVTSDTSNHLQSFVASEAKADDLQATSVEPEQEAPDTAFVVKPKRKTSKKSKRKGQQESEDPVALQTDESVALGTEGLSPANDKDLGLQAEKLDTDSSQNEAGEFGDDLPDFRTKKKGKKAKRKGQSESEDPVSLQREEPVALSIEGLSPKDDEGPQSQAEGLDTAASQNEAKEVGDDFAGFPSKKKGKKTKRKGQPENVDPISLQTEKAEMLTAGDPWSENDKDLAVQAEGLNSTTSQIKAEQPEDESAGFRSKKKGKKSKRKGQSENEGITPIETARSVTPMTEDLASKDEDGFQAESSKTGTPQQEAEEGEDEGAILNKKKKSRKGKQKDQSEVESTIPLEMDRSMESVGEPLLPDAEEAQADESSIAAPQTEVKEDEDEDEQADFNTKGKKKGRKGKYRNQSEIGNIIPSEIDRSMESVGEPLLPETEDGETQAESSIVTPQNEGMEDADEQADLYKKDKKKGKKGKQKSQPEIENTILSSLLPEAEDGGTQAEESSIATPQDEVKEDEGEDEQAGFNKGKKKGKKSKRKNQSGIESTIPLKMDKSVEPAGESLLPTAEGGTQADDPTIATAQDEVKEVEGDGGDEWADFNKKGKKSQRKIQGEIEGKSPSKTDQSMDNSMEPAMMPSQVDSSMELAKEPLVLRDEDAGNQADESNIATPQNEVKEEDEDEQAEFNKKSKQKGKKTKRKNREIEGSIPSQLDRSMEPATTLSQMDSSIEPTIIPSQVDSSVEPAMESLVLRDEDAGNQADESNIATPQNEPKEDENDNGNEWADLSKGKKKGKKSKRKNQGEIEGPMEPAIETVALGDEDAGNQADESNIATPQNEAQEDEDAFRDFGKRKDKKGKKQISKAKGQEVNEDLAKYSEVDREVAPEPDRESPPLLEEANFLENPSAGGQTSALEPEIIGKEKVALDAMDDLSEKRGITEDRAPEGTTTKPIEEENFDLVPQKKKKKGKNAKKGVIFSFDSAEASSMDEKPMQPAPSDQGMLPDAAAETGKEELQPSVEALEVKDKGTPSSISDSREVIIPGGEPIKSGEQADPVDLSQEYMVPVTDRELENDSVKQFGEPFTATHSGSPSTLEDTHPTAEISKKEPQTSAEISKVEDKGIPSSASDSREVMEPTGELAKSSNQADPADLGQESRAPVTDREIEHTSTKPVGEPFTPTISEIPATSTEDTEPTSEVIKKGFETTRETSEAQDEAITNLKGDSREVVEPEMNPIEVKNQTDPVESTRETAIPATDLKASNAFAEELIEPSSIELPETSASPSEEPSTADFDDRLPSRSKSKKDKKEKKKGKKGKALHWDEEAPAKLDVEAVSTRVPPLFTTGSGNEDLLKPDEISPPAEESQDTGPVEAENLAPSKKKKGKKGKALAWDEEGPGLEDLIKPDEISPPAEESQDAGSVEAENLAPLKKKKGKKGKALIWDEETPAKLDVEEVSTRDPGNEDLIKSDESSPPVEADNFAPPKTKKGKKKAKKAAAFVVDEDVNQPLQADELQQAEGLEEGTSKGHGFSTEGPDEKSSEEAEDIARVQKTAETTESPSTLETETRANPLSEETSQMDHDNEKESLKPQSPLIFETPALSEERGSAFRDSADPRDQEHTVQGVPSDIPSSILDTAGESSLREDSKTRQATEYGSNVETSNDPDALPVYKLKKGKKDKKDKKKGSKTKKVEAEAKPEEQSDAYQTATIDDKGVSAAEVKEASQSAVDDQFVSEPVVASSGDVKDSPILSSLPEKVMPTELVEPTVGEVEREVPTEEESGREAVSGPLDEAEEEQPIVPDDVVLPEDNTPSTEPVTHLESAGKSLEETSSPDKTALRGLDTHLVSKPETDAAVASNDGDDFWDKSILKNKKKKKGKKTVQITTEEPTVIGSTSEGFDTPEPPSVASESNRVRGPEAPDPQQIASAMERIEIPGSPDPEPTTLETAHGTSMEDPSHRIISETGPNSNTEIATSESMASGHEKMASTVAPIFPPPASENQDTSSSRTLESGPTAFETQSVSIPKISVSEPVEPAEPETEQFTTWRTPDQEPVSSRIENLPAQLPVFETHRSVGPEAEEQQLPVSTSKEIASSEVPKEVSIHTPTSPASVELNQREALEDLPIDTPASIASIEELNPEQQREYDEQYARELERQLSPFEVQEAVSTEQIPDIGPSQATFDAIPAQPINEPQEVRARATSLEDIVEEPRSRSESLHETPPSYDDGFAPSKNAKQTKKGKKGKKKQQTVIWEDETATKGIEGDAEVIHGAPEASPRLIDLEEPIIYRAAEDEGRRSPTLGSPSLGRAPSLSKDNAADYFGFSPSQGAEEDVGQGFVGARQQQPSTEPSSSHGDEVPKQTESHEHAFEREMNQADPSEDIVDDNNRGSTEVVEASNAQIEPPAEDEWAAPIKKGKGKKSKKKQSSKAATPLATPPAFDVEDIPESSMPHAPIHDRSIETSMAPQQHSDEHSPAVEQDAPLESDERRGVGGSGWAKEGFAGALGLATGAAAVEELSKKDSKKEKKKNKKRKQSAKGIDDEKEESLDREVVEKGPEQETPIQEPSARISQEVYDTPPKSPVRSLVDENIRHPGTPSQNQGQYRDSAIHVADSPIIPEQSPIHRVGRDSGYPETEASPIITQTPGSKIASAVVAQYPEPQEKPTERESIDSYNVDPAHERQSVHPAFEGEQDYGSRNEDDVHASAEADLEPEIIESYRASPDRGRYSPDSGDEKMRDLTSRTEKVPDMSESADAESELIDSYNEGHDQESELPHWGHNMEQERRPAEARALDISAEASPEQERTTRGGKSTRRRSRRGSRGAYDSDDSADSGFDIQRRRRMQAREDEQGLPSPVSSTSKERSSALFDSSPSAREDVLARQHREHARSLSPSEKELAGRSVDRITSAESHAQEPFRAGGTTPELGEEYRETRRSLFGGPMHEDDIMSTPRSPGSTDSRGRRKLRTIAEDSAEVSPRSPLHGKGKRSRSDVGSPEQGVKAQRISLHAVDSGDERAPSRQSNASATLSVAGSYTGHEKRGRDDRIGMSSPSPDSIPVIVRTPDHVRSASGQSMRSSGTPPLRRVDRSVSSDLRGAAKKIEAKTRAKRSEEAGPETEREDEAEAEAEADQAHHRHRDIAIAIPSSSTYDPVTDKGKKRADMADYEGWGDVRSQSPMSPTRPPSLRKRQSMQFAEMEQRLAMLASDNRLLQSAKAKAEQRLEEQARDHGQQRESYENAIQEQRAYLAERDATLNQLNRIVGELRNQVTHLTELNEELLSSRDLDDQIVPHEQYQQTARELEELREQHTRLATDHEEIVLREVNAVREEKDVELQQLRQELENAREQVRELQQRVMNSASSEDVVDRDEDYFDAQCHDLCKHLQSWMTRFSKLSDLKRCLFVGQLRNEAYRDRFEDTILDGSEVDDYLQDRHKRRDVFMSVTMSLIFEHIFKRYLFGMDREHRQKLKALDATLQEVGTPSAVSKWRATTLALLSKRPAFQSQREVESEGVVQDIWDTVSSVLRPPATPQADQCFESLRRIVNLAVKIHVEMRLQRAEYSMLPTPVPQYDTNGDLKTFLYFKALSMNERSGAATSNEALEERGAVLRMVLFPLVVKVTDEDEQIVVCPAQVHVAPQSKGKKTVRVMSAQENRSEASFAGTQDTHMEGAPF